MLLVRRPLLHGSRCRSCAAADQWRRRRLHDSSRGLSAAAASAEPVKTIEELAYVDSKQGSLLQGFGLSKIRNFSIIAHIDHGKSTLSDALLVRLGNITAAQRRDQAQQLDTLKVERERGITVKAQTASMLYQGEYLLNLIDTPGHVDFSYEVVRSLSSCQGALLLVDATQGVQAQTLTTFRAAQEAGIKVLPVVTKIDLPNAQVEDTIFSMAATFDLDPEHVLATSAKTGQGIDAVLETIVKHVPPPPSEWDAAAPLRARVLDSWYDPLRGVVCLVQCVDGVLAEGDRISTCHLMSGAAAAGAGQGGGDTTFSVQEVGLLTPAPVRTRSLWSGQVGYMIGGIKSVRQVLLGDTVIRAGTRKGASDEAPPPPLPLFAPCRPNLFASCFPLDGDDFATLLTAVERLALNDASLQVHRENSTMLGHGLRVGFLGLLHMEVFKQRLDDEFNMAVLVTAPNVPYIFRDRDTGAEVEIENLADWPEEKRRGVTQVLEPMVEATVITPEDCLGSMLTLLQDKRGTELDTKFIDGERVLLVYKLPWQEVVTDLHDKAKSISSGYASLTYRPIDPEPADLVLCEMAINTEVVGALSFVSHRSSVMRLGRDLAARLKKVIPRQQFEVVIQARLGAKPFARERIPPYRKDVLIKSGKTVGGGDPSRKRKLLDKQKEGKRRAKTVGKVQLPQSAFWALLSKDDAG